MRKPILTILAVGSFLVSAFAEKVELKTEMDKISYVIGQNIGKNLQSLKGVNMNVLLHSLSHAQKGDKSQFTPEESAQIMQGLQKIMQAEAMKAAETNKAKGAAYLEANKKKDGVVTTKSGLQYRVIKAGTGKTPKASDTIEAHYHGTLIDGTKFDSSYDRGKPATFPVTGVIKGWVEALQLMKVGGVWELVIPSELAYGANPRPGGVIKPNAVLVFKIELVAIK